MEKSLVKTITVFVIIFGCFAVLYPRLFYPLLTTFLGVNHRTQFDGDYTQSSVNHPNAMKKSRRGEVESQSKLKISGHPGMHALSEMKKHANQKQNYSGRGILGIVLPLYAFGILMYLIYTLSRLFFFNKNNESRTSSSDQTNCAHVPYTDDNLTDSNMKDQILRKQKELEKLLWKADQEDIGDEEISLLKKRLIETENQMTRILEAMDNLQKTVSSSECSILQGEKEDDVSHDETLEGDLFSNIPGASKSNKDIDCKEKTIRRRINNLQEVSQ